MSPEVAAHIVEEMPEGVGADFLREIDTAEIEAVLANMEDREEAEHLRERSRYEWDTAGGLMTESFAAFSESSTVWDVLHELGETLRQRRRQALQLRGSHHARR